MPKKIPQLIPQFYENQKVTNKDTTKKYHNSKNIIYQKVTNK